MRPFTSLTVIKKRHSVTLLHSKEDTNYQGNVKKCSGEQSKAAKDYSIIIRGKFPSCVNWRQRNWYTGLGNMRVHGL